MEGEDFENSDGSEINVCGLRYLQSLLRIGRNMQWRAIVRKIDQGLLEETKDLCA